MESPIEVVRRFCAAWSDNIGAAELAAFFTDNAVYHNIPLTPVIGREAIAKTIASFIRPGAPGIESIEFRVLNIAANGPVVMTERVDVFKLPNKSFELQVTGGAAVREHRLGADGATVLGEHRLFERSLLTKRFSCLWRAALRHDDCFLFGCQNAQISISVDVGGFIGLGGRSWCLRRCLDSGFEGD